MRLRARAAARSGARTGTARAIEPADGAEVSTSPIFRWKLAPGTDAATLEFCWDRECTVPLGLAESRGTAMISNVELKTGTYYWRLRGHAGAAAGKDASEARELNVERRTEQAGKLVIVSLPEEAREDAPKLIELADAAARFLATMFKRPLPSIPTPIFFHGTESSYQRAAKETNRGEPTHYFAFTSGPGIVHMPYWSGARRSSILGPSRLEITLVHELSHAYQATLFRHYQDEPKWLREGIADLTAAQFFVERGVPLRQQESFNNRLDTARHALDDGSFIAVPKLLELDDDWMRDHERQSSLFYAEAYCLLAMIAASPDGTAKLREFLRNDINLTAFAMESRINKRFTTRFGKADELDRRLREWLAR